MDIESTGLTIVVPEDMEPLLANAKKDLFCDCTQSEMIRKLVMAGLEALVKTGKSEVTEEWGEMTCRSL